VGVAGRHGKIEAHAWVEVSGRVILGDGDLKAACRSSLARSRVAAVVARAAIETGKYPQLGSVALALWARTGPGSGTGVDVGGDPVLMLKGPELQARLYGTPAAYQSGDVDVWCPANVPIVPGACSRPTAGRSRGRTASCGASRTRPRTHVTASLDLHWGLQVGHLPPGVLAPVERALWEGARPGPSGMLEPDPESSSSSSPPTWSAIASNVRNGRRTSRPVPPREGLAEGLEDRPSVEGRDRCSQGPRRWCAPGGNAVLDGSLGTGRGR
jgi:hypothetical protein